MGNAKWIWYPGSFELYHSMLLHNRRTTSKTYKDGTRKSVYYYPMWRIDGPKHNAILQKHAIIDKPETIKFYSNTETAIMSVDGVPYAPGSEITLEAGGHRIFIQGFKRDSFPAFYIDGDTFASDRTYTVASDDGLGRHAGYSV